MKILYLLDSVEGGPRGMPGGARQAIAWCHGKLGVLENPVPWKTQCPGKPSVLENPVSWKTQCPGKLGVLENLVSWKQERGERVQLPPVP